MVHTAESRQRAYEKLKRVRSDWLKENGPCQICGSDNQLEVDHIDPTTKISHSVWSWKQSRREAELAKCQVLCNACHKKKTSDQKRSRVKHGSETMYGKYGCRCSACVTVRNQLRMERRKKRAALGLRVT